MEETKRVSCIKTKTLCRPMFVSCQSFFAVFFTVGSILLKSTFHAKNYIIRRLSVLVYLQ